jgi:hypothetical protein
MTPVELVVFPLYAIVILGALYAIVRLCSANPDDFQPRDLPPLPQGSIEDRVA